MSYKANYRVGDTVRVHEVGGDEGRLATILFVIDHWKYEVEFIGGGRKRTLECAFTAAELKGEDVTAGAAQEVFGK